MHSHQCTPAALIYQWVACVGLVTGAIISPGLGYAQETRSAARGNDDAKKVPSEFIRLDSDRDAVLTQTEFLVGRAKNQMPRWMRDFRVMDLDQNATLSVAEFSLSLALTADSKERGTVPDPIVDRMEVRLESLLKAYREVDSDKDGKLPAQDWSKSKWEGILPELTTLPRVEWDHNQDGNVTEPECRFLLEVAYGVRGLHGLPLRTATGFVVNWPYLRALDKNNDSQWSKEEIITKYWGGPQKGGAVFQQMDSDADGLASVQEVWKSQVFYRDIFKQFLEFDKTFDGEIDDRELSAGVTPFQKPIAAHVFKAFDSNSDGKLSLEEFRSTPIANPVADWHVLRTDGDGDGKLSESEFHADKSPFLICLCREFFQRFDLDHDGVLTADELPYSSTSAKPTPQFTFQSKDRDADGKLTLNELFSDPAPVGTDRGAIGLHRSKKNYCTVVFKAADLDENGYLASEEYENVAKAFRPTVMNLVLELDLDGDSLVSDREYLGPIEEPKRQLAARDFLVMDFDADGHLTGWELSRIPNRVPAEDRAPIPDPIVDWMEQQYLVLIKTFQESDEDGDGKLTVAQWPPAKWTTMTPEMHGMKSETWDQNHDGHITVAECRALLEIADGVRRPDGLPLRLPTGHVINWPFLRNLDKNRDEIWSRDEFIPKFWAGPEKGATVFKELDIDANDQLTLQEIWKSPVFFRDIVRLFYDFDRDFDGAVDNNELLKGVTGAQSPLASRLMHYYDLNGDAKLSLYEFRASPIANIMTDWHLPRFDNDFDGKLSEVEFYCEPMPLMLGLSREYFRRYDENQDGFINRSELLFFIDFKQVKPDIAFEFKDRNEDGFLNLSEFLFEDGPPTAVALDPKQQEAELVQAKKTFNAADSNQDESLDLDEYRAAVKAAVKAAE